MFIAEPPNEPAQAIRTPMAYHLRPSAYRAYCWGCDKMDGLGKLKEEGNGRNA
jgi:hypothetical protein